MKGLKKISNSQELDAIPLRRRTSTCAAKIRYVEFSIGHSLRFDDSGCKIKASPSETCEASFPVSTPGRLFWQG